MSLCCFLRCVSASALRFCNCQQFCLQVPHPSGDKSLSQVQLQLLELLDQVLL